MFKAAAWLPVSMATSKSSSSCMVCTDGTSRSRGEGAAVSQEVRE